MKRIMLTLLASIVASAVLSPLAVAKKQPTNNQAVAAITQFENDAVKANLAGDSSFVEKNYAEDWTGGFSGGIWTTKESVLADAKDSANNKMNSEQISDLKVRIYDNNTAIATYTDTYDGMVRGEHRVKTVLSTDTFVRQNGMRKLVAGHSSVAKWDGTTVVRRAAKAQVSHPLQNLGHCARNRTKSISPTTDSRSLGLVGIFTADSVGHWGQAPRAG